MVLDQQTELDGDEVDFFLGRHETGVLSLARDGEPYSVPISYGYDSTERVFYIRLVSAPESRKRQFLLSSLEARLVVYEEDGAIYRSVVASGSLEEVSPDELTVEHIEQYGAAKRPLFEIWGETKPELDIQLYLLDPDDLSGRQIEIERTVDSTASESQ